jgi:REP element-mobilizing transposase RayT
MPRARRVEVAGGIHHVTAKAPYGRVLFIDDQDRVRYLVLLAKEVEAREWTVLTFCQMTNHVHLLIRTPQRNLGEGIKSLHERFATDLNRRHRQHGHVFGARFKNGLVQTDRHLHGCFRYIARNPIEAGLCATPGEWPWSGHRSLVGLAEPAGGIDVASAMEWFGPNIGAGRIAYQQLVAPTPDALLDEWVRADSLDWLPTAVDVFGVAIDDLADRLGLHRVTVHRRLDAARRAGEAAGQHDLPAAHA